MTSRAERAAGSRSSTVRMSSRIDLNITLLIRSPSRQSVPRRRLQRERYHRRRVPPLGGKPAHGLLDHRLPDVGELFQARPRRQLGARTARGEGRPAPVGLKARLGDAPLSHAEIEPREIHALLVFTFAYAVGLPHHPRVPRVAEVIEQRRAVLHYALTGDRARSFWTRGTAASIT